MYWIRVDWAVFIVMLKILYKLQLKILTPGTREIDAQINLRDYFARYTSDINYKGLDLFKCSPLKIGLLVYKCLHGLAPGYLSDQCIPASTFVGRANMRSSSRLDRLLYVPRTKTKTLGPRGFYYASSALWNSLPVDLRDPGLSLHSF